MPFYLIHLESSGTVPSPNFKVNSKGQLFLECNGVPNKENLTKELKNLVEKMKNPYGPSFEVLIDINKDKFGKTWNEAVENLPPEDQFYFNEI